MKTMETRICLKPAVAKNSAEVLNMLLSDEFVFLTKMLNYHWNITGPNFIAWHKLLDKQYHDVFEIVDEIAERVRSVGGVAFGSLQQFSKNSRIKENAGKLPSANEMIADLTRGHEQIICAMREAIPDFEEQEDFGSMDFVTKLLEQHEKMAWFLRAHLQEQPV